MSAKEYNMKYIAWFRAFVDEVAGTWSKPVYFYTSKIKF